MKISKKQPQRIIHGKRSLSLHPDCVQLGLKHLLELRVHRSGDNWNKDYEWYSMVNSDQAIL